jgi:acyl-ACP thioesterase
MYLHKHTVGFAECGADGTLRLADALSLMVNCCQYQENADKKLSGYLKRKNLAVFLYSIQIDMVRMPSVQEEIEVCVKIYDIKSILGFRRITITDSSGHLCAVANAIGAFYDVKEKRTVRIDPDEFKNFLDEAEEMKVLPRKIQLPSRASPLAEYTVQKSDIDPNGHMQSAKYLAIAEDRLPAELKYDRVRIEFKQQSFCGDKLNCALRADTNLIHVVEICAIDSKPGAVVEFSAR